MGDVKNKLKQDILNIESELLKRDIKLRDFLKSVPVSASSWSLWKNRRRTANAELWAKVEDTINIVKNNERTGNGREI